MYGNDEPPPTKKGKKSKSKSRREKKELDDELLARLPPAYPTTDVGISLLLREGLSLSL